MRAVVASGSLIAAVLIACGGHNGGGGGGGGSDAAGTGPDACVGLQCNVVDCRGMSKPETQVSGTVFAPNGTLPLSGITVYVPGTDPGAVPAGAQCSRCNDALPGNPVVVTTTDALGKFSLLGIPAGDSIPIVITSGKWRRLITIPHVDACSEHPLAPADTRLPRDKTEGDLPQIAITTGGADSLECLVRKLGVADTEITTDRNNENGRVQLYVGKDLNDMMRGDDATDQFKAGFGGRAAAESFSPAETLWGNLDKLKTYDIVMLSCEGAEYTDIKPQAALDAMKAYANYGGRVFASHWHNVWIKGYVDQSDPRQPELDRAAEWPEVATWNPDPHDLPNGSSALINEDSTTNPKGQVFADWMLNVHGSTVRDQIVLQDQDATTSTGRSTCNGVEGDTERWVYLPGQLGGGTQNFQFTTPHDVSADQRCGKVVFSDMHVSGFAGPGAYPDSCGTSTELTPQEKALAFMFFDIASCVDVIF